MLIRTTLFALLGAFLFTTANFALAKKPTTKEERIGYSLGVMMGRQFQHDATKPDVASLSRALEDVFNQRKLQLTDDEMSQVMHELQQQIMANAHAAQQKQAEENLANGEKFLANNAKQKGVKTTASGLQYKVLKQGKGKKPAADSKVRVNYEGSIISGEVFDSSYQRGEPIVFQANQVISGWQEGLQLMQEGSEFMFYIPADLAYGPAGAGGAIGPNETLIFKVELIEVNPAN